MGMGVLSFHLCINTRILPCTMPSPTLGVQLEAEAEVEGLVESEAEAAALGAGHLLFMDQQSQVRHIRNGV